MRTRHAEQDDLRGVHHPAADPGKDAVELG